MKLSLTAHSIAQVSIDAAQVLQRCHDGNVTRSTMVKIPIHVYKPLISRSFIDSLRDDPEAHEVAYRYEAFRNRGRRRAVMNICIKVSDFVLQEDDCNLPYNFTATEFNTVYSWVNDAVNEILADLQELASDWAEISTITS